MRKNVRPVELKMIMMMTEGLVRKVRLVSGKTGKNGGRKA